MDSDDDEDHHGFFTLGAKAPSPDKAQATPQTETLGAWVQRAQRMTIKVIYIYIICAYIYVDITVDIDTDADVIEVQR